MISRCGISGRPKDECLHCCSKDLLEELARLLDEWETDRRDLWRRALDARSRERVAA